MSKVRVVLADDHTIVRQGLHALLASEEEIEVVGDASDGRAAVEKARELCPDVVLMDIAMPGLNGIEATRQLASLLPTTRVIILSMYTDPEHVVHALSAGAAGYVRKNDADAELVTAIRTGTHDFPYLSPHIDRKLIEGHLRKLRERAAARQDYHPLTPREREVLQLVAEGKPNKRIAATLGIAMRTVEVHRASMMRKLGVADQAGLVRYAVRKGIVSPDD